VSRKLLVVAYSFPPHATAEAYACAKKLGGLRRFQIDVVCAAPFDHPRHVDHSLDEYVRRRFHRVIPVGMPSWMRRLSRWPAGFRLFSALNQLPDRMVFLNASTVEALRGLDLDSYDAVITCSQFHSAHLVGLALRARVRRLPWIAHFSDPWADNPYNAASVVTRHTHGRMERQVIETADHVVFTSELTRELVMRKYPRELLAKTSVVPHAFDPALYPQATGSSGPAGSDQKLVIRHLGRLYRQRSPAPLFRALELLQRAVPGLLAKVRFDFVGTDQRSVLCPELRRLPERLVSFSPRVDYLTSLRLMREADALLLIDAPARTSVFLPSKLVDYIGANRPILGVTPRGTAAEFIRRAGGLMADPADPSKIAAALREVIGTFAFPSRPVESGELATLRKELSVEAVSGTLDESVERGRRHALHAHPA
jgi:glycosyltransferase involved in cell wall biosynthesis